MEEDIAILPVFKSEPLLSIIFFGPFTFCFLKVLGFNNHLL